MAKGTLPITDGGLVPRTSPRPRPARDPFRDLDEAEFLESDLKESERSLEGGKAVGCPQVDPRNIVRVEPER